MRKYSVLYDDIGLRQPFGGVSRYFYELISRLDKTTYSSQLSASYTINAYFSKPPFNIPSALPESRFMPIRMVQMIMHARHVFNSINFLLHAWFGHADIVHATAPHEYSILIRKKLFRQKLVLTIHDLIPELWDKRANIRNIREETLRHADQVIAVSNFTKDRLLEEYPFVANKVTVVHHGYNPIPPNNNPRIIKDDYLLFVGQRTGYKNFQWMIQALTPLFTTHPNLKLVCAGSAFTNEEESAIAAIGLHNHVVQTTVNDTTLANLYAHAVAFIYPSRMEGFGLPILEAFSQGCPVVLANASCFPEIAGNAAIYFNADNMSSLQHAVEIILTDTAARDSMIKKGFDRLKSFSWTRCAQETADVYQKALCV